MLTIFLRTILVYLILIAAMRLMGKRQLGELEITELVTTLLISEIATLPIVDQSIPLMYAVIPLITILALEVALSMLLLKCPRLKCLTSTRPSILIRHGKLQQAELKNNRISLDELISEIRQAGLSTPEDVDYAIVEQNGKLSILPRQSAQPPSARALGLRCQEPGMLHPIIQDGRHSARQLKSLGLNEKWLEKTLQKAALRESEVFLLGINDAGELYWIKKEEKQ